MAPKKSISKAGEVSHKIFDENQSIDIDLSKKKKSAAKSKTDVHHQNLNVLNTEAHIIDD